VVSTGVYSRPLIGRSREVTFLLERARGAVGRSGLIVVRGEAGIGKTRLVTDFAALARKEGKLVAVGTAREFANGPYGQFSEALTALGVEMKPPATEAGADGKHAWYAAVADALGSSVSATPHGAVVILDDLHWADGATIDLLRFVCTRLADAPVLFVATYRNDEIEADTARARAIGALERDGDVVTLHPLAPGQIEHLIMGALRSVGRRIDSNTIAEIRDLADGRPFFAEELLRGVLERLQRDQRAIPTVPTSVRVTVRERYASLDPSEREVLLHAAVFGRHFSAEAVSELLGVDLPLVYSSLRHARDLQLIVEDEGDDEGDRFAFRHALTREAVYGEMLRAEARSLHGRVAALLASRADPPLAEIAEHTWRARNQEDTALWNERAADAAFAVYAYADAARFYERAFRSSRTQEQQARTAERAAEAWYTIGDLESSADWYAHASKLNGELGRRSHSGRLSLRRARVLWESGRLEEGLAEASRLVSDDHSVGPALRLEAEVATAGLLVAQGRPGEALERLQNAEKISANVDAAVTMRLAATHAHVLMVVGKPGEARSRYTETIAAAQAAGDTDLLLRTYNNWGTFELQYGTLERASELYETAFRVAAETRRLRHFAWLMQNAALAAILAGNLDAAGDFLKRSDEIDHGVALVQRWTVALRLRVATLRALDDDALHARALHMVEEARATSDTSSFHILGSVLAYHAAAHGAFDDAARLVADAAIDLERAGPPYWIFDVTCRFGDRASRARARAALARIVASTPGSPIRGAAALAEAREALRERDREAASGHADAAAAAFGEAGWLLEAAFANEVGGRLGEAVAAFRAMGAIAETRRLTETSASRQKGGGATLTAREREIARLVVAGKTARSIAEALVISERTVESHIASTYRKLGVSGRAALASLLDESEG
jgi:DNA-binding NarL/FixJ family response regulator/predicted negative regulator of RcsB-dependent stress response